MQYVLLIYGDERATAAFTREQMTEIVSAHMTYGEALRDAKVLVGSNRLRPISTAKSVRIADGQSKVLDGHSPRRRNSSVVIISSMCPTKMPLCHGRRAVPVPVTARSKCGRSGLCDQQLRAPRGRFRSLLRRLPPRDMLIALFRSSRSRR